MMSVGISFFVLFLFAISCKESSQNLSVTDGKNEENAETETYTETVVEKIPTVPSCEERFSSLTNSIYQKDLELYYKNLPYIVSEVKVYPVLYLKKPIPVKTVSAVTQKGSKIISGIENIRSELKNSVKPYLAVRNFAKKHVKNKQLIREVFLSQGYFFDDNIEFAKAMVRELRIADLFDDPVVFRVRNNRIEKLTRKSEEYFDSDGKPAFLHLNERLSAEAIERNTLFHLDLTVPALQTGARRIIPKVVDENEAWVELIFPSGNIFPALIGLDEGNTKVLCIGKDQKSLTEEKKDAAFFWSQIQSLKKAVDLFVEERPMFDEPSDEPEGEQEDGILRQSWKEAYFQKKKKFLVREVEYDVFNKKGAPIPPQVCADYVFDVWERAFGTWYVSKNEQPSRKQGVVDFSQIQGLNRRHIASVLDYSIQSETTSPFERYDIPRRNWVPLKSMRRFVINLLRFKAKYREGDILVIHGLRDEDEKEHFHTVIILETDPITGFPTVVTDNQGRPRITSLKTAMRSAPRRSIKYILRIHPKLNNSSQIALKENDE